jgi:hypothetical protein
VNDGRESLYREVQRFRQPRRWLLVVATATLFVLFGVGEAESTAARAGCLLAALGLLAVFAVMRLTTEVTAEAVEVSFLPFHRRRVIRFEDIERVEHHPYRAVTPLGRWGLHLGFGTSAYNIDGDGAVELVYGGRSLVVGSQRSAELADLVRRMQRFSASRGTRRV